MGWERGTGEGGGGREGRVRVGVGERDWWGEREGRVRRGGGGGRVRVEWGR